MSKTDYLEDAFLNHALRNTVYSSPSAVYVGLYTITPTDSSPGTEVSGGSYIRQAVVFSAPSGGTCSNALDVSFPTAGTNWGSIIAFGISDSESGGNLMYYGTITTPRDVYTGDQIKFPAGQLTLGET